MFIFISMRTVMNGFTKNVFDHDKKTIKSTAEMIMCARTGNDDKNQRFCVK